jgi:hypothetical protein
MSTSETLVRVLKVVLCTLAGLVAFLFIAVAGLYTPRIRRSLCAAAATRGHAGKRGTEKPGLRL